ncbi:MULTISPECIES: hypothetical protein [unclassified Bradyrhizobium]|uniref:hypothetical protein n=1 Tax=unclassified Bradyrhizobium TaxID=2631580 RepID=UPI002479BC35|nr:MULTISPECIES: hypothetical protein [unclassified Bradyrhizobium]WGR68661.1 hypothetical protein MTX24_24905 [Bradyrhizobium sp. ISRA426]WGR80716.1 hypothetical protein MTX21_10020 [Bradyrhizobium sp. ISRA430]WGR83901.1 hypothetical protein MTX25_24585 [Bradyrhizobium sp. ISRA432]
MSSALAASVLVCAVCFNAILSIVNGHVVALARVHVVLAEVTIYAGAIAIIVSYADRKMWPWLLLALFIVSTGLLISAGNGAFNAKYVRDVLVIPIFIMLGMTYQGNSFALPFLTLHTIIVTVAVFEVVSPYAYAELFKILSYYINTRDFSAQSFWNTGSTLFVSATRPGTRFFSFVEWHRVSSVFLEPVSLGNYCAIAAALIVASWYEMNILVKLYLIGSTFFLLVACDGRLAAISILVIVLVGVLRNVTGRWSVSYLPVILFLAAGYVWTFSNGQVSDNFSGRITSTIDALSQLDVLGLMGLNAATAESVADNGIVYFILSQSLIGVVVIWLAICLFAPNWTAASRSYVHGIMIFIPLNLLVSYSFFSIKIASLMWFVYGYRYMKDLVDETRYARDRVVDPAMYPAAHDRVVGL